MDNKNSYNDVNEDAKKIISKKAWLLVGLFGFTSHDVPDIQQELMLAVIQKLKDSAHEKEKNSAFIRRIIESKVNDLIKHRQAACRDWRKCQSSLNEIIMTEDTGPLERIETLKYEDERNYGLELDMESIIENLPQDLKELCALLKQYGLREVLCESGLSKAVFQKQMEKLRCTFKDAVKP